MHTHRFGRKIKLPATIALKHQLMKMMLDDLVKAEPAEAAASAEVAGGQSSEELPATANMLPGHLRQS
jgi:hypothetical protein